MSFLKRSGLLLSCSVLSISSVVCPLSSNAASDVADVWADFIDKGVEFEGSILDYVKDVLQFAPKQVSEFLHNTTRYPSGGSHGGGGSYRGTLEKAIKNSEVKDEDGNITSVTIPNVYDLYGKFVASFPGGQYNIQPHKVLFEVHLTVSDETVVNSSSSSTRPNFNSSLWNKAGNITFKRTDSSTGICQTRSFPCFLNDASGSSFGFSLGKRQDVSYFFRVNLYVKTNSTTSQAFIYFGADTNNSIQLFNYGSNCSDVTDSDSYFLNTRIAVKSQSSATSSSTSYKDCVYILGSVYSNSNNFYNNVTNNYVGGSYGNPPVFKDNTYNPVTFDTTNIDTNLAALMGIGLDANGYLALLPEFGASLNSLSANLDDLFDLFYSEQSDPFSPVINNYYYNYNDLISEPEVLPPSTVPVGVGLPDIWINGGADEKPLVPSYTTPDFEIATFDDLNVPAGVDRATKGLLGGFFDLFTSSGLWWLVFASLLISVVSWFIWR